MPKIHFYTTPFMDYILCANCPALINFSLPRQKIERIFQRHLPRCKKRLSQIKKRKTTS